MKKVLVAIVLVLAVATAASAEVLSTANTLGAGSWGWLGAGQYTSTTVANSNSYGIGGYIGYGILDNLDIYAKLGYGIGANPAAGVTVNGINQGLSVKYSLISGMDAPFSLALGATFKTTTTSASFGGAVVSHSVEGDLGLGLVASKIMVPWVPYAAVAYHSLNMNTGAATGSKLELAVGTQMLLSASSAIIGEIDLQSTTWGGAAATTATQISLGYSAKI